MHILIQATSSLFLWRGFWWYKTLVRLWELNLSLLITINYSEIFYNKLNLLHPSLKFTMEKETDDTLPFLDVKIEKDTNKFLTSVYRKPTFIGQYTPWDSFGPPKCKTNLIGTLVHRALKICSKNKLQQQLDYIRSILRDNGYQENIINTSISKKIT